MTMLLASPPAPRVMGLKLSPFPRRFGRFAPYAPYAPQSRAGGPMTFVVLLDSGREAL
jgi:hypothetical protein